MQEKRLQYKDVYLYAIQCFICITSRLLYYKIIRSLQAFPLGKIGRFTPIVADNLYKDGKQWIANI